MAAQLSWLEHSVHTRSVVGSNPTAATNFGPVVKRLRHRPFTAVTRVRFSSGSPQELEGKQSPIGWLFLYPFAFFCKSGPFAVRCRHRPLYHFQTKYLHPSRQLSWIERPPPKRQAGGSNPLRDAKSFAGKPSKIKGFRRFFIFTGKEKNREIHRFSLANSPSANGNQD